MAWAYGWATWRGVGLVGVGWRGLGWSGLAWGSWVGESPGRGAWGGEEGLDAAGQSVTYPLQACAWHVRVHVHGVYMACTARSPW